MLDDAAAAPGAAPGADDDGYQLVKIHVPELNVQKCLQFSRDQLVWDVKQQCLASLPKVANWYRELKESFNYGLFSPPVNGKAGKFLDEERRLGDYPFSGPVGYLELKYKRRVYKMLSLDEKQLKSLHTRANLRRLLDYVTNGQVEKITKVCSKGLDPNFHCQDSGETPLTLAATVKKPAKVLIALVNGGALLDYRTRDGSTAMHRAVEKNSLEAVRTLLELGASPNYRDSKGLTPLYLCVTHGADAAIAETLLHDHATIGAQDLHGWQEVHQACKNGLRQHLEHLLFYGADMNARNASGNTPLHMCAVNGQETCARQLLFRGCDRDALNYANQTPYQVAVIAGNLDLADLIQNYRPEDVVPFRGPPSYNPKRRSGIGWLPRAPSERCLTLPPSPCPSDRSSAPFSSASSSLSEGSAPHGHETDTASIVTVLALGVADKSLGDTSDIISDSSGVGTANSDTTNCSLSMPGTTVVCIENYSSNMQGHLRISEGDIIEVTGTTDCGLLEGTLRGPGAHSGLFPAQCVQEVRLRHGIPPPMMITARDRPPSRVVGRRETISKHFATAPRVKKTLPAEPRTVVLHRARKGFGFILRGAKATSPLMELVSDKCPALQYLDDVDKGGVADMAGLKKGDFLLEINGEDVSSASHEHVVDLIRKSGDLVSMTVVSLGPPHVPGMLPTSKSAAALPAGIGPGGMDIPLNRQCATLPRKLPNSQSGNLGTLGKARAPMPPRRDPKTTLSVGRARAKSMVAGLEGGGEKEEIEDMTTVKSSSAESIHQQITPGGTCTSTPVQPRTASIRARPTSSRITAAELEELFQRQQDGTARGTGMGTSHFQSAAPASPAKQGKVYASVAEMKRSKGKASTRVRFFNTLRRGTSAGFTSAGNGELHRDFHSTPDLAHQLAQADAAAAAAVGAKAHRSQEDVTLLLGATRPAPLPPPSHPPPPPPIGQVVKVDVSRASKSEYDSIAAKGEQMNQDEGVMSSFRPAASAKLYASPEDMKTVGYRSRSLPSHSARPQVRKSHSLRTNASSFKPPMSSTVASGTATLPKSTSNTISSGSNPYAQPIRASRSHSTVGARDRKSKRIMNNVNSVLVMPQSTAPPPIPEPDYSLSESEMESEEERDPKDLDKAVTRLNVVAQPAETSGNSNTSGSSSGSGSMQHSFSVDEIQKVRTQLKSSKSYPNDFLLKKQKADEVLPEDCDNSSSGVSSDQEIPVGPPTAFDDRERIAGAAAAAAAASHQQRVRSAVSLAQLPPPIEADTDEKEDIFVPPPPEFEGGPGAGAGVTPEAVLAPPPQFSDSRQVTRVRIVGAVPKTGPATKQGRLHSQ